MFDATKIQPCVVHAHNYGHGNLGDDAMADNVYRKLQRVHPDLCTISTYSPPIGAPSDRNVISLTGICLNYNSLLRKCFLVFCHKFRMGWLRRIYILASCRIFYTGAILYKNTGIIVFLSKKKRALLRTLSNVDVYIRSGSGSINDIWYDSSVIIQYYESLVCKIFGGTIVFTGQGIGPITSWRWERVISLSKNADYMTFRDCGVSERLLRAHGVYGSRYTSVGDDAFDLPATPFDLRTIGVNALTKTTKIVCLQFRTTDYEINYTDNIWSKIGSTLSNINEKLENVLFIFLPMSYGRIDDLRAGKFIKSQYSGSNFVILDRKFSANEAKGLIAASDLAIGQSYHFGVFALSSNVPFIGVYTNQYYRLKTDGLLQWYDQRQWGVPVELIEEIDRIAVEIFCDWDEHVAKLRTVNAQIQNNIDMFYNTLLPRLTAGDPSVSGL